MSLKLIPVEKATNETLHEKSGKPNGKKQFNPGHKIKKNQNVDAKNGGLKSICLSLIHFINRGSRFTHQQIDDLIIILHRSILSLQKKKQEMMKKKKER